MLTEKILCKLFDVPENIIDYVTDIEKELKNTHFVKLEKIRENNQYKVIHAMQKCRLNYTNFYWNTGYGYDDPGREKVEEVYSTIFNTEDALVRPTIASGTHALYLTLSALLKPGEEVMSITGRPYDTLLTVLGIENDEPCNLKEYGVGYSEIDLDDKGDIDIKTVLNLVNKKTKILMIQRSTGYSFRSAITIDKIHNAIKAIKNRFPNIIIMVDNCYGEFIEDLEPTDVGADLCVGSLIKNPGGGIALTGGYIVGKRNLISIIANRLTAPGIGKEVGLTFDSTRLTLQGLFFAPHVVSEALKGALLFGAVYKSLGFEIVPEIDDNRSDIIQSIKFLKKDYLTDFCEAIQSASPVDSYVVPQPWDMPGYSDKVIMAAGAFIQGSSIELSADAPIRTPYIAYVQGGLFYDHAKLGVINSLNKLSNYKEIGDKLL